jgi:hypothetical protein
MIKDITHFMIKNVMKNLDQIGNKQKENNLELINLLNI